MVKEYFVTYGVGFVFIAGFTPIPYKLFTIAAGTMHMTLLPFVIASFIGRGARFFLVAMVMFYKGEEIDKHLTRYIERISWAIVSLLLLFYIIVKLF